MSDTTCSDCRKISASARMGSSESSEGLNSVNSTDSPSNQVAKSVEKVSARDLQIESNMVRLYQYRVLLKVVF